MARWCVSWGILAVAMGSSYGCGGRSERLDETTRGGESGGDPSGGGGSASGSGGTVSRGGDGGSASGSGGAVSRGGSGSGSLPHWPPRGGSGARDPLPYPSCAVEVLDQEIAERCGGTDCPVSRLARFTCPEAESVGFAPNDDGLVYAVAYGEDVAPDGRLDLVAREGAERTTGAQPFLRLGWRGDELVLYRGCECTTERPGFELERFRREGDVWNLAATESGPQTVQAIEYTDTLYVLGSAGGVLTLGVGEGAEATTFDVAPHLADGSFHGFLLFDDAGEPAVIYQVEHAGEFREAGMYSSGEQSALAFDVPGAISALWQKDVGPLIEWLNDDGLEVHGLAAPATRQLIAFGTIALGPAGSCPSITESASGACPDREVEGTSGTRLWRGPALIRGRDGDAYFTALEVDEEVRCSWVDVTPGGCRPGQDCTCEVRWGASRATGGRLHVFSLANTSHSALEVGPLVTQWEMRQQVPPLALRPVQPSAGHGFANVFYWDPDGAAVNVEISIGSP